MDSLAGPVVRDVPIQGDPVAEVGVVAVLLLQVFGVALLGRRQRGGEAASAPAPEALDQAQGLGQTWTEANRRGTHVRSPAERRRPGGRERSTSAAVRTGEPLS